MLVKFKVMNVLSKFGHARPLSSRIMYATDGQTSGQKQLLLLPSLRAGISMQNLSLLGNIRKFLYIVTTKDANLIHREIRIAYIQNESTNTNTHLLALCRNYSKPTRSNGPRRMTRQASKSNFDVVWPWPLISWPPKLAVSLPSPLNTIVPVCSKVGSFVCKIVCSQNWQQNKSGPGRKHCASVQSIDWRGHEISFRTEPERTAYHGRRGLQQRTSATQSIGFA